MPLNGQDLSASRWATTTWNTNTVKKHYDNSHNYGITRSTPALRSTSPSKRGMSPNKSRPVQPDAPKLTPAQKDFQLKVQSYDTFKRYSRRLKWKSTALLYSHQRTLRLIHSVGIVPSHSFGGVDFPMQAEEAETMFKIDFFEYYTILENTLVHLLKVFGIEVSAIYASDARSLDADGLRQDSQDGATIERDSLIGDSRAVQKSRHSYHANVLAALDKDSCPLKEIMGQGSVRDYLGIAKEWRNKWKNIEDEGKDERIDGLVGSRYEKLIQDLKLEEMIRDILVAIERGEAAAGTALENIHADLDRDGLQLGATVMEIDQQANELVGMLPGDIMEWD